MIKPARVDLTIFGKNNRKFKFTLQMKPDKLLPEKLDLVMRDDDFVIYYDGEPLETPEGALFAHSNARVLKHILLKLHLNALAKPDGLNSAYIFSFLQDRILAGQDIVATQFDDFVNHDFVMQAHGGGDAVKAPSQDIAIGYLTENPYLLSLVFWSNSVIMEGFRSLLADMQTAETEESPEPVKSLLRKKYDALTEEQKAGITLLSLRHKSGLLLPMMLVLGYVTASEYANSTMSAQVRQSNSSEAPASAKYAGKAGVVPLEMRADDPMAFVREVHEEALKALEFLGFFVSGQRKISVIHELISMGEGDQVEFKSTFRWDIRQGKKNPAIEHASLKTMAAFLNSDGGDLLIGVEDDGNILGIELDKFPNDDKFLLHLWSLIKSSMGQDVSPYIKTTLEKFDGKTVCRVHCIPGAKPVFLRQKGFDESFYIRIGPSSGSLEISEALKYIADRFKS